MFDHDPDIISTIARDEPEFFRYVEEVRASNGSVVLTVAQHPTNKEVIWACLWYALERGVLVTITPEILLSPLPDTQRFDAQATAAQATTAHSDTPSEPPPSAASENTWLPQPSPQAEPPSDSEPSYVDRRGTWYRRAIEDG